ncbi:MAG: TonB-dependent receptor [Caulobacteraceae bacterium]|nr:TonB-dependent receptor [Caulobacter sp.]
MLVFLAAAAALSAPAQDARMAGDAKPPTKSTASKTSKSGKSAAKPAPGRTAPPAAPTSEVVVKADPDATRISIDRKSYSLSKDLQSSTGSLADALRNIPSVQVGLQGELSLRGDPNVTVLVDGKPSALFSGQNRADALQQLPADQYERVEVLTNPSAAFRPDGTGGIINLITRKGRRGARTGSLKANLGTGDRYNASASANYSGKKLTVTANVGVRHDSQRFDGYGRQQLPDPVTGALTDTNSTFQSRNRDTSENASLSVDYDLDPKTRVSAAANAFHFGFDGPGTNSFRSAAATGPLAIDYDASSDSSGQFTGGGGSLDLLRRFAGEGHELSAHLSYDAYRFAYGGPQSFDYLRPAGTTSFLDNRRVGDQASSELKIEYKRPLAHGAKLVAGYQLDLEDDVFDQRGRLGATEADAQALPSLNNVFDADQAVHALYATYERTFGRLSVLPGLRLEEAVIDTDQKTSGQKDTFSYFDVYPTLHLSYKLDPKWSASASFSRRVQRPDLQSLNPYLIYNGPLSYSQGDPRLRPAVTESYEFGVEKRHKQADFQATLFFRNNHDTVENVVRDLGDGVLLNTQGNLGSNQSGGLEFVFSGKIGKKLSYNSSFTLAYNKLDAANLGFAAGRSDVSPQGRVSLNWEPTKKDLFQMNLSGNGEQLTPQGYNSGFASLTGGYRHTFNDKVSGVLTIKDPFGWSTNTTVIDTPTLKQRSSYTFHQQALYLGLTYAFGASGKRAPETFDFGGGGGPGGPH